MVLSWLEILVRSYSEMWAQLHHPGFRRYVIATLGFGQQQPCVSKCHGLLVLSSKRYSPSLAVFLGTLYSIRILPGLLSHFVLPHWYDYQYLHIFAPKGGNSIVGLHTHGKFLSRHEIHYTTHYAYIAHIGSKCHNHWDSEDSTMENKEQLI